MNRRRTLTLIEITVMLLVFVLAATLCMVSFLQIENCVRENVCRDRALTEMQNAGEELRHCGGDFAAAADRHGGIWDGQRWVLDFGAYQIYVKPQHTGIPALGGARLEAIYGEEILFTMDLRWQEVAHEA